MKMKTIVVTHNLKMQSSGSVYCSCGYDSRDSGEIALGNPNHDENN